MSDIPKIKSYEDYDVLQGKNEASRETWKTGTFHSSDSSDPIFAVKVGALETSADKLSVPTGDPK
jgi:hypothetical protein